jgi:hypothetical protein
MTFELAKPFIQEKWHEKAGQMITVGGVFLLSDVEAERAGVVAELKEVVEDLRVIFEAVRRNPETPTGFFERIICELQCLVEKYEVKK